MPHRPRVRTTARAVVLSLAVLVAAGGAAGFGGVDRVGNGDSTALQSDPRDAMAHSRPQGRQGFGNPPGGKAQMGMEVMSHVMGLLGSLKSSENGKGRNADHTKGLMDFFNQAKSKDEAAKAAKEALIPTSSDEFTKAMDEATKEFGEKEAELEKKNEENFEKKAESFDSTMEKQIEHNGFDAFSSGLVDKDKDGAYGPEAEARALGSDGAGGNGDGAGGNGDGAGGNGDGEGGTAADKHAAHVRALARAQEERELRATLKADAAKAERDAADGSSDPMADLRKAAGGDPANYEQVGVPGMLAGNPAQSVKGRMMFRRDGDGSRAPGAGVDGKGGGLSKYCRPREPCEKECQIGAWRAVEKLVQYGAITAKCTHFDPRGNRYVPGNVSTKDRIASPPITGTAGKKPASSSGSGSSSSSSSSSSAAASSADPYSGAGIPMLLEKEEGGAIPTGGTKATAAPAGSHVRSKRAGLMDMSTPSSTAGVGVGPDSVSGFTDGATAADNLRDAFCGVPARLSKYGDAPGGSVCLSTKLAQVLVEVAQVGVIDVNSLAGSSHSWHQAHYQGHAVDIGSVNGQPLDHNHRELAAKVIAACRRGGAVQIFNINMDCGEKCEAHTSWVHCRVAGDPDSDEAQDEDGDKE